MSKPHRHKRYFWRRVGGFLIDWLVLSILFIPITLALQLVSPVKLYVPGFIKVTACETGPEAIKKLDADKLLPLSEGETRGGRFCTIRHFGLWPRYSQSIYAYKQVGGGARSRYIAINVDRDGNPIRAVSMDSTMFLFAPAILAWLLLLPFQSPGKAVMRLRVQRTDGAPLTIGKTLARETLKLLPFSVIAIAVIYQEMTFDYLAEATQLKATAPGPDIDWAVMAPGIALFIVFLGYYLLPLARWRGAMLYDKWLGLAVERKADQLQD